MLCLKNGKAIVENSKMIAMKEEATVADNTDSGSEISEKKESEERRTSVNSLDIM